MMVKREHLPDAEAFHHHLAGTIREGPFLIPIESLKCFPGSTLNLLTDMDNHQDAPCLHLVDRALERHRVRVAYASQALVSTKTCSIGAQLNFSCGTGTGHVGWTRLTNDPGQHPAPSEGTLPMLPAPDRP